jgi:hypothetical protein
VEHDTGVKIRRCGRFKRLGKSQEGAREVRAEMGNFSDPSSVVLSYRKGERERKIL